MRFRIPCHIPSIAPVIAIALTLFAMQTATAQTTTGNSTTGASLWTSKGCSGCHSSSSSTKANAINAGGHITHANTQGMGGQADTGTQYNDIAAYFATLFTDLSSQSVPHNTATTITIPNFVLNTSYGDYVGLRAVTSPSRGAVAYTLGSLDVVYTPTTNQCGSDSFTYQAYRTVNTGTSNTRTVSLTIANPAAANISGSSGTISGTVGTAISNYTPSNSGGTATSYAITSGTLPGGLSLNTSTGVISGTPTASGTSAVTLTPYNCSGGTTNGQTGTAKSITITIITTPGAPTIGTVTPGNGQLSVAFTAPGSNGNSTITGYTATCGAFSNTGTVSPITVSGLTNGTSYTCSVTASNAAGTGSASSTASGTPRTTPGAPTIGTATAGVTSASVAFTAPSSNGGSTITGYTATCGSISNTGTASPITVSGLTAGAAVTCSVTATNAAGTGSASSASNSVTPYTTPGAPTIGTVTPGNAQLSVAFTAPASNGFSTITGYTATCGAFSNTGASSPIVVGGLTNGTSYSCSVTATNAAGTGAASGTASGTPRTTPGAPTIGTATAGITSASVTFTAPASNGGSTITGYTATCGSTSNTGTASPITVSGLTAGTAVTCSVTATNAAGTGSASSASNSVTPYNVPGAPAISSVTSGNATLSVAFTAGATNGSSITGYTATCGAFSNTGAASPIVVSGLTNGTSYSCSVTATNAAGTGSASSSVSGTPATVPGAPTIGTATAGITSATVTFTAPASTGGSAITSYTATCGSTSNSGTASPITVSGLTAGSAVTCTVTAANAIGTGSASSASNSVIPYTTPGAPTIGTASAGIASATVSFTAPASTGGSTITGYTVTCGSTSNTGTASPITVSGLTAGTAVTCTVKATNAAGSGSASSASNSVTPYNVPGAPTIIAIAPGNGSLTIAFSAATANGSAITLYRADCGASSATGTSSPITVSGLTNGTTYMCLVYATNAAGDGASSALSSGTPSTVPGAPTIGTATAGDAQVSVAFTAPASSGGDTITGYTATCGSASASNSASPITVTGLTNGTAVTCTVAATNARGTGASSAASNSVTPMGTQTITFGTAPSPTFVINGTFTVSATGGASGNPVVFTSQTPSICTVSGSTVTMLALGTCTIAANQAASAGYTAAAQVTQSIVLGVNGYLIKTIAGGGTVGDNVTATSAVVNQPRGVVRDSAGNIYVAELAGHRVRKITPDGRIFIIAGTGSAGFSGDGGLATGAQINSPRGLAIDAFGNLYIADTANNRVRLVTPGGTISTIAGTGSATYSGDGGAPTSAGINPWGVAIDASGNLYIAELQNNRIRKISGGVITTVVGTGTAGNNGDGGSALAADIDNPQGVAVDLAGNIYVASPARHNIRKVDTSGTITLFAGTGTAGSAGDGGQATAAQLDGPVAMAIAIDGTLFVADINAHRIRKITSTGMIGTHSGTGTGGYGGDGGAPSLAQLNQPAGVWVTDSDTVWIADQANHRVRFDNDGTMSTIAGNGSNSVFTGNGEAATSVPLSNPHGLALDASGNLYVSERGARSRVRRIDASGTITTLAGSGAVGFADATGVAAQFRNPRGLAIDASGNLYLADTANHRVRMITPSGVVTTIAGSGTQGFAGDGGPATSANLNSPRGVAVRSNGDIYIADTNNARVRVVSGGTISTFAGTGIPATSGDNGPAANAQINAPDGLAVDYMGALYIADSGAHRVRKVDLSGNIGTFAGVGSSGTSGDGGPAQSAALDTPTGVGFDSANNVYIVTATSVRRVDASTANISTFAGTPGTGGFSGDGGISTAALLNTAANVVQAADGSFYVADTNNNRVRKVFLSSASVPGAPTLTSATGSFNQISVAFTAPASDGGSAIVRYTATCGTAYATGTASPIVISNLVGGTAYSCSVTATNDVGTGAASSALSATPYGAASAPVIGTATGGINQISIAFTAPLNNGGSAISGYRAVCGPFAATGSGSPVVVTGIPGGSAYSCQVAAITTAGDGVYSSYSNSANVTGAPGAPTGATATAGNAQVSVAFTAPASNGGSAITGYTATCGAQSASGAASPILVTGLTNGTAVTCTVTATNAAGTSANSAASNSVTPATVPMPPTIGTASAIGGGNVTVSFAAPSDNGGSPVTGYIATCGSQSATAGTSPITVGGLTIGVPVSCNVQAVNAVGTGSASASSNSVTPFATSLTLVRAFSRKSHGSAGSFELDISLAANIDGNITVEPRNGSSGHEIHFVFDSAVVSVGSASVRDSGGASIASATLATSISGNSVVLQLGGLADNQRVTLSLANVNGATPAAVAVGFLVGDVNSSRSVNAADLSAIKQRAALANTTANSGNFIYDINLSGSITSADLALAKSRSAVVIP